MFSAIEESKKYDNCLPEEDDIHKILVKSYMEYLRMSHNTVLYPERIKEELDTKFQSVNSISNQEAITHKTIQIVLDLVNRNKYGLLGNWSNGCSEGIGKLLYETIVSWMVSKDIYNFETEKIKEILSRELPNIYKSISDNLPDKFNQIVTKVKDLIKVIKQKIKKNNPNDSMFSMKRLPSELPYPFHEADRIEEEIPENYNFKKGYTSFLSTLQQKTIQEDKLNTVAVELKNENKIQDGDSDDLSDMIDSKTTIGEMVSKLMEDENKDDDEDWKRTQVALYNEFKKIFKDKTMYVIMDIHERYLWLFFYFLPWVCFRPIYPGDVHWTCGRFLSEIDERKSSDIIPAQQNGLMRDEMIRLSAHPLYNSRKTIILEKFTSDLQILMRLQSSWIHWRQERGFQTIHTDGFLDTVLMYYNRMYSLLDSSRENLYITNCILNRHPDALKDNLKYQGKIFSKPSDNAMTESFTFVQTLVSSIPRFPTEAGPYMYDYFGSIPGIRVTLSKCKTKNEQISLLCNFDGIGKTIAEEIIERFVVCKFPSELELKSRKQRLDSMPKKKTFNYSKFYGYMQTMTSDDMGEEEPEITINNPPEMKLKRKYNKKKDEQKTEPVKAEIVDSDEECEFESKKKPKKQTETSVIDFDNIF
jgi:hypothetical protein